MRGSYILRKVQLVGRSSYTISLPKDWIQKVGVKHGSYVSVIPRPDNTLVIMPNQIEVNNGKRETVIKVPSQVSPEFIVQIFISYYLAGYNVIRLMFDDLQSKARSYVKEFIRHKLIGVELIEESINELTFQCLVGVNQLSVKKALDRISTLTLFMQKDAITALKDFDKTLAENVVQRDDDIDRLYFFIVRQLKSAVNNPILISEIGLSTARDCLGYRLLVKSIERIADHAARIAETVMRSEKPIENKEIIYDVSSLGEFSRDLYENALRTIELKRLDPAYYVLSKAKEVIKREEKTMEKILRANIGVNSVIDLKLILESIKRIAGYSMDIAEICLNLAVGKVDFIRSIKSI